MKNKPLGTITPSGEGPYIWTVSDGSGGGYDTVSEDTAQILSSLWRIESKLRKQ